LRFAVSESTAYEITRKRREIDNGPSDHYSIYLQLSGRTSSEFDEQTFSFTANDMGVYDGRLPFRALHAGRRAIAVVPRDMLELRAPWLRARLPYKFGRSPYLKLARRHLLQLSTAKAPLGEVEASLLTENLCNLIVLASSSEIEPGYLPADLQTEAILAFCRQNLHDPELSPQRVAGRFRMSVRTLHARFSRIGQTFGRWVLENRLEACRAALRDENQRTLNISDIAYRWGFNDLSHFNKSFRARFGTTPREWRNEAAAA
jgi:AraC-like DNA-binding protein